MGTSIGWKGGRKKEISTVKSKDWGIDYIGKLQ